MSRGAWGSRLGFILAAAGSAVGLGNIWKFPYITGVHGGGLFVLVYLFCIAVVGVPVLMAEVLIGRSTQRSPVGAFMKLKAPTAYHAVGWLGVLSGFVILSFYSVVAGWSLHYTFLAATNAFAGQDPAAIEAIFGALYVAPGLNVFWHLVVMTITVTVVLGGVSGGIETAVKFLMPALLLLMSAMVINAFFLEGFPEALSFIFAPRVEDLSAEGFVEALGHGFFTLSLGMGAMLTYGSYLQEDDDIPSASLVIALLDTFVALAACLIIFPIIFSSSMEATAGPGLVFASIPVALSQMTGGNILSFVFFALLFFAALSSAISLLEVVASSAIDQLGWSRKRATLGVGLAITVLGIPSALSGGTELFGEGWEAIFGKNFFDGFDWIASNVLLPVGGLLIALYTGWAMPEDVRRREFCQGSSFAGLYPAWLFVIRYVSPVAVLIVFLFSTGILPKSLLEG
ncbi:MAG: sodium-dependent transporter [Myxococcota bacterium]